MLIDIAIPLAILTMIMTIPLFLSYNIKYVVFPEGLTFGLLYFWGLASVGLVPILLIVEILVLTNILRSSEIYGRSRRLRYTFVAISLALTSYTVFLVVRKLG
jgi:hypothetical protein